MTERYFLRALFLLLAFVLTACGGGGDGGAQTPAPVPPTATIASGQPALAGATIMLDGSGSTAAAGLTLSYNWVLTSKPVGSAASLQNANSAKPSLSADLAGDYLLTLTVNDGQLSSPPATRTVTVLQAPSIQTSPGEPLSETVTLSLSGYTPGMQVAWYVDQALIASGASVSWDSTKVGNGSHVITAWLEVDGKASEIRRTVAVANSDISLSAGTTGIGAGSSDSTFTRLNVRASSPRGIASVAVSLDGKPLGVLTSMNACTGITCSVPVYQFVIENKTIISGEHVAVVTATDAAGATRQVTVTLQIANPPVITLDTPVEGAIVSGTLLVAGSFASDKPGPVTFRAKLGDLEFLKTTQSPFQASYDLKGLPPGSYVLTVRATDSSGAFVETPRTVVVTGPSTPLPSTGAFSIQTVPAEPLSETVTFSLSGYTPGMQLAWYVDQAFIASGASVSWDSTKVANGSHLVTAWLDVAGKVTEIRRAVAVANSPISLRASTLSPGSGPGSSDSTFTRLNVSASSPGGIASVAASLDGKPLGVLTSMNACVGRTCSVPNIYQFVIENKTIISGEHVAVVTATDAAGATRQVTVTIKVANPPVITLDTPAVGAVVSDTLLVSGSFSSDKPGTVTFSAKLGDVEFLKTTQSPFQASYDLKGLPPGAYLLTVRATDGTGDSKEIQRQVAVAASSGG